MCPHIPLDCKGPYGMSPDMKKAETPVFIGDFGLSGTALELEMVEVGGIEPPSESARSLVLHA